MNYLPRPDSIKKASRDVYRILTNVFSSKIFLYVTFGWFIVQAFYIALAVKFGIPPDESFHFNLIKLYSESGLSPILLDQVDYYFLGEVVKTPFFLYHWLLSIPFSLFADSQYAYLPLRIVNIALGVFSLMVIYKISDLLKVTPLVRNISLFMFANTLMFVFLSSAISYDNLFLLLSLGGIYLILQNRVNYSLSNILALFVVIATGLLTKVTFIPLALILLFFLVVQTARQKNIVEKLKSQFFRKKNLNIALMILLILFSGLVLQRYGSNLIQYGTYKPACDVVLEVQQCQQNYLYNRNQAIYGYDSRPPELSGFQYLFDWMYLIQARTIGVLGHVSLEGHARALLLLQILTGIWIVLAVRLWNKHNKAMTLAIIYALFYGLIVLIENNGIYNEVGRVGFAIHGRYIFTSLALFYIVGNYFVLHGKGQSFLKSFYVLVVVVTFFFSSLPTYLSETSPYATEIEWRTNTINRIHEKIGL